MADHVVAAVDFERFVEARGLTIDELDAEQATRAMVDHYIEWRADEVDVDEDGDMLLFQWGSYGSFQYNVTRQLITQAEDDEDEIWQLSLTLHYPEDDDTGRLGSGERWCYSPDELDEFVRFIEGATPTAFARSRSPERVELEFGPAD